MIISFVGHSSVNAIYRTKEIVKEQIRSILTYSTHITCFLGGYGDFDEICATACRELKQECTPIELVYVTPYISLSQQRKIKEMQNMGLYDSSIYFNIENTPMKFAILKRNEIMVAKSDIIIAYVKHNYGGAYKTLQVAKRKKKKIINICDFIQKT